jgi:hypothetical protein
MLGRSLDGSSNLIRYSLELCYIFFASLLLQFFEIFVAFVKFGNRGFSIWCIVESSYFGFEELKLTLFSLDFGLELFLFGVAFLLPGCRSFFEFLQANDKRRK